MDRLFDILVHHFERMGLSADAHEEIHDALHQANAEVRTLRQQVYELKQAAAAEKSK